VHVVAGDERQAAARTPSSRPPVVIIFHCLHRCDSEMSLAVPHLPSHMYLYLATGGPGLLSSRPERPPEDPSRMGGALVEIARGRQTTTQRKKRAGRGGRTEDWSVPRPLWRAAPAFVSPSGARDEKGAGPSLPVPRWKRRTGSRSESREDDREIEKEKEKRAAWRAGSLVALRVQVHVQLPRICR
jgi:hypothetical protein